MKVKIKDIIAFGEVTKNLFEKDNNIQFTKLGYAIRKLTTKHISPVIEGLNKKLQDVYFKEVREKESKYALKDEKTGEIIFNQNGGLRFDEKGAKQILKLAKASREKEAELLEIEKEREVEIEPFIISEQEIPFDKITAYEAEALFNFVLPVVDIEKFIKK